MNEAAALPPSEEADDALVGRVLAGRYHVRELIASGGMASVYRGSDLQSKETVAVKVMHAHLTRDRGFARRFKREASIASRLSHPNIVRVIDHGSEGHLFFLVMELLDGEDIFDVLRAKKRLDPPVACRIVSDICDALAVAHAQNIVHRDLKPENVFLCRMPGERIAVKVLDFGVAKMVLPDDRTGEESETALTAMGTLLGTPEYLSPEMCRGETVGPLADVYACGVVLYALVTGRPPFVTERPLDVTMKHISEEPLPPSWFAPGLDPRIDAIVLKALAKHPDGRQQSAAVLAEALRELEPLAELPPSLLSAPPPSRPAPDGPTLSVPIPEPAPPKARTPALPRLFPPDTPSDMPPPMSVMMPPVSLQPPTTRSSAVPSTSRTPSATPSTTRMLVAAAVLALTFAAGFALGRMSAPAPAPVAPVPAGH